jgi:general secretion pathway protein J
VTAAPKREAGFTLVEMLVAMTLLGFLTVLLFGGLRLGTRTWERTQQSYAGERALQSVSRLLAANIAQTYPLQLRDASGHVRIDFDGRAHALSWISAAPTARGAMTRLRLRADNEAGAVTIAAGDELASGATPHRLAGIAALQIRYFGRRADDKAPRWGDDWHDQPWLPTLIRLRLQFQDRAIAWREIVVAPRLSGDAGCVLDALTGACRGHG